MKVYAVYSIRPDQSILFIGLYDVDTGSAWTPFVGLGIGISKLEINDPGFSSSEDDNTFTYQFIGGVACAFNEQWAVDAQYRNIVTSDVTIDGADFDHSSNDLTRINRNFKMLGEVPWKYIQSYN
ncbi:MAG: porin family protein, partial [Deltaproteobacteria bacterium]|nr:porin family protein [Deltaproteobacteria bacterium]